MSGFSPVRVAVLDDYQGVALSYADWSALEGRCAITVFRDTLSDLDALAERLAPFDVICLMRERTPLPAGLIARLPSLKLVVTTAGMNAAVDKDALRTRGIPLCGTGAVDTPTAELAWGLIIALARQIVPENVGLRCGGWQTTVGADLAGSSLGVIGLGKIGSRMARVGAAFGMSVLAWSQNLDPAHAAAVGAQAVSKETLFEQADFITLHLRLSERTHQVVAAPELARMKPSAFLVNTSRGPLIDATALRAALEGRRIAGAALDVHDVEPMAPDDPLRKLDRVLATPHLGYVTHATYRRFYGDTVEGILAWLEGAPVRVLN